MSFNKFLAVSLLLILSATTLAACKNETPESTPSTESTIEESGAANLITPSISDADPINADNSFALITESSTLEWEASRLGSNPHIGTVAISEGTLLEKDGQYVGGQFVIDMLNITDESNNERLISHISNEDFFNVVAFPTATFVITSITEAAEANSYTITGDLTILGITNMISFAAEMNESEDTLNATAAFSIDRTRWGITYDSGSFFQQLGDRAIKDDIQYRLDLTFSKG